MWLVLPSQGFRSFGHGVKVVYGAESYVSIISCMPPHALPRYRDQRDRPDLTNPDSLALYLDSRFEQLRVSVHALSFIP